jgi:hypothetical protein
VPVRMDHIHTIYIPSMSIHILASQFAVCLPENKPSQCEKCELHMYVHMQPAILIIGISPIQGAPRPFHDLVKPGKFSFLQVFESF